MPRPVQPPALRRGAGIRPRILRGSGRVASRESVRPYGCERVGGFGSLVVRGAHRAGEAEVGEAQGLGEHPALTVVLGAPGFDARVAGAGCGDEALQVVEGGHGEDRVAEFGILLLVDPPKAFRVERAAERLVAESIGGVIAVAKDPGEVVAPQTELGCNNRITRGSLAGSLVVRQSPG